MTETFTFYRNLTPEAHAEQRLRWFAQLLPHMSRERGTGYVAQVLARYPLDLATVRCPIGGLRSEDWMPVAFAARDLVIAQHGGASHFAVQGGWTVLVPNHPAAVTEGETVWALKNGGKIAFSPIQPGDDPYTSANTEVA